MPEETTPSVEDLYDDHELTECPACGTQIPKHAVDEDERFGNCCNSCQEDLHESLRASHESKREKRRRQEEARKERRDRRRNFERMVL